MMIDVSNEIGIANNEISVVLQFIKKMNRMIITKNAPSKRVSFRLLIEASIKSDCLKILLLMFTPLGRVFFKSAMASSKRSVSSKVLTPGCFEMVKITAGDTFNEPSPILSAAPICTVATSLILMVCPFTCFKTASCKSSNTYALPLPLIMY